jgi:membrane associated rhomboid family serine protease
MLSDRPYMRDDYQRERTSFLVWLLSAMVAGFVVQKVFEVWLNSNTFEHLFALSVTGLRHGFAWTLFTYPLLHAGILHLLVLVLSIFFLGRELLPHLGERRMAWLTLGSIAVGGLVWFAVNFARPGGMVIGSTSLLLAYLTVFACLFPNREISFLVFFVLPITTRPKYIAWLALFVTLCGLLFGEIPGGRFDTGIPHSAHLGGMLAGWLYYRFIHEPSWFAVRPSTEIELPRWLKRAKKIPVSAAPALRVNGGSRADLRAEVDRILDKINSHGFGALTPEEKRLLDEAKENLSRR